MLSTQNVFKEEKNKRTYSIKRNNKTFVGQMVWAHEPYIYKTTKMMTFKGNEEYVFRMY
jgi:hypothetical protein